MPLRGRPSKSHTGLDYETRKGSKFYTRDHHEIRPYRQKRKNGGAVPNKALLIKLLGGTVRRRPRRVGGQGFTNVGFQQRGFY